MTDYTDAWKRARLREFAANRDWRMVFAYAWWLYGWRIAPFAGCFIGAIIGLPIALLILAN